MTEINPNTIQFTINVNRLNSPVTDTLELDNKNKVEKLPSRGDTLQTENTQIQKKGLSKSTLGKSKAKMTWSPFPNIWRSKKKKKNP